MIATDKSYSSDVISKLGFWLLAFFFAFLPLVVFRSFNDQFILPKAAFLRIIAFLLLLIYFFPRSNQKPTIFNRQWLPALFLLLALLLSSVFSQNIYFSIFGGYLRNEGLITYISYILIMLFASVYISNSERIFIIGEIISLTIIIIGIVSVLESLGIFAIRSGNAFELTRSASTIGNPIYQGIFLVTLFPLVIYMIRFGNNRQLILGIVALAFGLLGLYLTYSRTALIGAFLAVPLSFYLYYSRKWDIKKLGILMLSIILLLLITFILNSSNGRFSMTGFLKGSLERRLNWINTLYLIKQSPLKGYGLDTYKINSSKFIATSMTIGQYDDNPHNEILSIGYSLGLIGTLSYFWLIVYCLARAYKFIKEKGVFTKEGYLALTGILMIVWHLFGEITAFSTPITTPYLFLILGILLGLKRPDYHQISNKVTYPIFLITLVAFFGILGWQARIVIAEASYKKALSIPGSDSYLYFEKAINSNPYVPKYYENYSRRIMRDRIYSNQSSIYMLSKALRYFPQDISLLLALGDVYQSSDPKKSLHFYKLALRIAPKQLTVKWAYADALILLGNYEQAINILENIAKVIPDNTGIRDSLSKAKAGLQTN